MLRSFRFRLAAIVALGLAVRWITVFAFYKKLSPPPVDLTDNTWYWLQAKLVAHGDGFANPIYWWRDGVIRHSAGHPPLYTAYLAMFARLGFDTPLAMRLASGLLGALGVGLVGGATKRVSGSERAALLAALFAALYPNLWINDGLILSESMFVPLVAGLIWATYLLLDRHDLRSAALVGLIVGLSCLTRSESQLYFVTLLPLVTLWGLRRKPIVRRLQLLGAAGLIGALVVSPWVIKNMTTFEHPVGLAIGAGFVLEVANCDDTYHGQLLGYWSDRCGAGWADPGTKGCVAVRSDGPGAGAQRGKTNLVCDESVVELVKRKRATQYISDHTSELPKVVLARVGRIWNVYRPLQGVDLDTFFERRGHRAAQAALWSFYGLGVLAAVGFVTLWRRRIPVLPFVTIIGIVTFTAATTMGITRYRVGAEVVWVVLAGIGADAVWSRLRRPPIADTAIEAASSSPISAVER